MGRGIAHAAALGGYRTILEDLLPNALRRAETEIRTTSWGKIVGVSDPFGHGLCLIEFLGRGYDEIAESVQTSGRS